MPKQAFVSGATVEVGFHPGRLRREVAVQAFAISKHPITIQQFGACVEAGACAEPKDSECTPGDGPLSRGNYESMQSDLPLVCPGLVQAEQYCAWVGGALPKLAEWFLAARGQHPNPYAWGHREPECSDHPLATPREVQEWLAARADRTHGGEVNPPSRMHCNVDGRTLEDSFAVGLHPKAASPSGLQDVLLSPGELVAGEPGSLIGACGNADAGCVIYGGKPGAIDSAAYIPRRTEQTSDTASAEQRPVIQAYSFRCTWRDL
jgi:hypothetical protein